MATPAYTHFSPTKPNPTTENGAVCFDGTRNNLFALVNALAVGSLPEWPMWITTGTGSATQPQYINYGYGVYRIRGEITYNGSGQVTTIFYQWSNDTGSTYATVKTQTFTYDAGTGAVIGFTWS